MKWKPLNENVRVWGTMLIMKRAWKGARRVRGHREGQPRTQRGLGDSSPTPAKKAGAQAVMEEGQRRQKSDRDRIRTRGPPEGGRNVKTDEY